MPRLLAIHPVLPTKDVEAAVAFYVARLGFAAAFADSETNPRYAGVRRDDIEIHLQWHSPEEWERDGVDRPMLRIVTEDVQAFFDEYEAKDVFHAATALRKTGWGTEEFAFYDADRNGLTFYRDVADGSE